MFTLDEAQAEVRIPPYLNIISLNIKIEKKMFSSAKVFSIFLQLVQTCALIYLFN